MIDTSAVIRRELGSFLRSRRERLAPEDVGLPATSRRRTPGLRREEVAVLAGVGVTWYTWLEQGRPINVSRQVLDAVARALRLDAAEQRHLHVLTGVGRPDVETLRTAGVPASLQAVLDQLSPFPACVQTPVFDVLAYNRAYEFLFADMDRLAPEDRNCAVQFFTDPEWRGRYADDGRVAARMVARLRTAVTTNADPAHAGGVVERLRARSAEFDELWSRHDVLAPRSDTKRMEHPAVGALDLDFVTSTVSGSGLRLTVMTPVDPVTDARLRRLAEVMPTRG